MKQESFEQRLRQQMEGYEVAPPEDLWEQIEKAVDSSPVSQERKKRARVMPLWMRVAAAGVVAAMVCGTGYELLKTPADHESLAEVEISQKAATKNTDPNNQTTKQPNDQTTLSPTATQGIEKSLLAVSATPKTHATPNSLNVVYPQREEVMLDVSHEQDVEETVTYQMVNKQKEVIEFLNEKQVSNESSTSEAHSDTRYASGRAETDNMKSQMAEARVNTRRNERMKGAAGTTAMPWNTEKTATPISHSRQKATADVTLYASNGLNGQQGHISPVAMSPNMMMGNALNNMEYYSAAKSSGPVYLSDYEERREYHQPVKYGISVGIRFDDRWGLKTGVNYQSLKTDFIQIMGKETVSTEKTYQYVGVPVQLSYDIYKNERMTAYGQTGAEIDVNVKARQHMEGMESSLKKGRPLLSAVGGAGVQVNCLPWFSIYVEPGLSYNLNNGGKADVVYKSKPLQFDLQTGIRIGLNK